VKLLVLGGYGGFGGRISHRLRDQGFEVVVAGRSLAKASAFCAGEPSLEPAEVERNRIGEALACHCPWAVIDAAGPFQTSDYRVAEAAIAAGSHYLDIADGRAFVNGIGQLAEAARAAGVAVISGASSLPALSGAVVRFLAEGLEEVKAVEIALSATSRGTAGRSVLLAILSYIGRPIALWHGRRWTRGIGWQGLERHDFAVTGARLLRHRLVGLAEVPDLDLLPARLPGAPATVFRAGTDLAWHNIGLWLLSWPVRWGWFGNVAPLGPWLSAVQRLTRRIASRRSGMKVRLFGIAGTVRIERRWTLLADNGDGPEIPTLAIPLIVARLASGKIGAGAVDAGTLLDLADFAPAFAPLAISSEALEIELPPPLYARMLGPAFLALPPAVREMHAVLRDDGACGRAEASRGRGLAGIAARLFGFPGPGEHRLHVAFAERDGCEIWTRDFAGHSFSSELKQKGELLVERFGPVRFGFALPAGRAGLAMILRRWWIGPIPMPRALAPRIEAREWEAEGRFHFSVAVALPWLGPLFAYRGWLARVGACEPLDGIPLPS
jgi:uncharacterized protein YbjT (DUF2867 family)